MKQGDIYKHKKDKRLVIVVQNYRAKVKYVYGNQVEAIKEAILLKTFNQDDLTTFKAFAVYTRPKELFKRIFKKITKIEKALYLGEK